MGQDHDDREPEDDRESHEVEGIDAAIVRAVAPYRETWPVKALSTVGELADQPPMIASTSATLVAGLATGNDRLARAGARMLAAHLLATGIKTIVKNRVDRTRPQLLLEDGEYHWEEGDSDEGDEHSFPSGHTAGAVAVARSLTREYPGAAVPAAVATTLVAGVQVPSASHFPSDVVAGAAIGLVAEILVDAVATRVFGRD